MKPSIPLLSAISSISLLLTSCTIGGFANKTITATGADISGVVEAKNISSIETSQAIVVNYTVAQEVSVSYSVPESLSHYLEITCTGGRLECGYGKGISINSKERKVVVNVTAPSINSFEATSASRIVVSGELKVNDLNIEANSAGSVEIAQVEAVSAEIVSSSTASVTIAHLQAQKVDAEASSTGTITLYGTITKANIDVSSSGGVSLNGTIGFLNADASSAGRLNASQAQISSGNLDASSAGSITVSEATETPYKTDKSSGGSLRIL